MIAETPKQAARRLAGEAIRGEFTPEKLHAYTQADGSPIYWRIRARLPSGEKWIRPMHLNGGGYKLGEPPQLQSGPKPLYRLDLLEGAKQPIFFVEGEKAADALIARGVIATTAGGATSDDRADFAPLASRDVRLWADNDEAGRGHMARVAAKLRALGSRVSEIDSSPLVLREHGDAADYLDAHPDATAAELMALACFPNADTTPELPRVELLAADRLKIEPIRWLWDGWLARGKLHILAGAPGTGKTTLALSFASTVSKGGRWPDGSTCEPGEVLIWSGEDDPADTLAPRLAAMGAELPRVRFVGSVRDAAGRRAFDPAIDCAMLMEALRDRQPPRLLIVDPIVSAVAGDSHKNAEVRRSLAPLVDLAAEWGCVLLGISHFTKGTAGRDPVERVTGSLAFGALARMVLASAKKPEDQGDGRLFARAKSNIGPDGGGFEYALEAVPVPKHPTVQATRVQWGQSLQGTARELLADADADQDAGAEQRDAADWLRDYLTGGPVDSNEVKRAGEANGISWATLRRAKKRIGAESEKDGMSGGWSWFLPKMLKSPEDAHPKVLSTFGKSEHLRDAEVGSPTCPTGSAEVF